MAKLSFQKRRWGPFVNWNYTTYILIDFTALDLKIKNNEKIDLLFYQQSRGCHFSTLKFDPKFNDVLYLSGF